MTIYQNIDKNRQETFLVMLGFTAVVCLVSWFIGEYYFQGSGYFMTGIALIFSGISSFVSYYFSDSIVLSISGAVKANPVIHRDLLNLVQNMSIASGIKMPRVYLIDDTAMNAFATGRDQDHSVIVFTTGIVSSLEKRELEGVVAHEMSHIGNQDILLMSIVSVLVGTVTLLSDWFTRGALYGGGRKRSNSNNEGSGIIFLIGIVLILLSPLIATLIKLAIGRNREYLADSTAALITRYPLGLANALRKLAGDNEILEAANGATAHLYIKSPIRGEAAGFFANMFNTHPPIEDRIRRLENM
ncbi:M48 family metallopeptidase [candidate division WWE3 bacterium]|uniref:Protease HtpX homolog n=1 Tax=candidate division WWE3 bacterium TaxID=2053526 RepID=A0A7X9DKN3_UNCKA|nr:M48 family metallopeptidase [candidate division WWE3 bacterium]